MPRDTTTFQELDRQQWNEVAEAALALRLRESARRLFASGRGDGATMPARRTAGYLVGYEKGCMDTRCGGGMRLWVDPRVTRATRLPFWVCRSCEQTFPMAVDEGLDDA